MRQTRRSAAALTVLVVVVLAAAACGQTPVKTGAPTDSAVPGVSPGSSRTPSISTPWGPIVVGVPATFPVFPSAASLPVAQVASGPVSAAWTAPTGVIEVAAWYRDQLSTYGFIDVEMRPATADGTRVIDAIAGSAGCEAQVTVRASGGATMITVLWGIGCAKLGS